ncbi:MAG: threonine--tRNA ligase [Candidatus Pacebacteria bacterium RIFOXYB1_FULL_39_46]|nr:MAG: threonine--tRNA ligase [Candidatus Pacebacteria bacterium RIFOXYA1_FULL_38_18]OGJ38418.1 MAG: threonine--tRNA ligase [Candidatus Pacebacteria bacterium RIFOXYB1_FULL_39_46]OGJ40279.1 MAG: threonine--tRNA ligase [Candidatus Pacebacteria bacterium RIFOXYC1_FULL_39_21]OGJ40903.1 MAG: threonine--tRNA ligase [Candidatus Pacebacteria bacterium RIFOXYD1_FULL_39_27]
MAKPIENSNQLLKIRHTTEHVLTMAMLKLYGADKVTMAMGPATDDGFYFDFDSDHDFKISETEFPKIEAEMQRIIDQNLPMSKQTIAIKEARKMFAGNAYKQEWLDEIEAKGEEATVYWLGEPDQENSFVDLCAGPHVESTGEIKAFKLLSIAGAYWHGDEKNKMLTRIYGTAFESPEELDSYIVNLEEAKKRDHRKLGRELDLFSFSDLVGPGLPLWSPKGTILRNLLDDFVWQLRQQKGYSKVEIPHITKKDLYEVSGHWDKFGDELFRMTTKEGHEFVLKPMNCPHHAQIYARKQFSYREMPQRYSNTTMVYRDEQTGELTGLSRVRSITQDDSHVFCRQNQVTEEVNAVWDIVEKFYQAFDFELQPRLSLHDPKESEKYLGKEEQWLEAEEQLRKLVRVRGVEAIEAVGEAAFYGPKLDFMAYDSLGREWQVATIQLDFNMPERFDLFCINEVGEQERIVMIHVAIMGSVERFLSIIIEHFGGAFPVWLAPVQAKILPIADRHLNYAQKLKEQLATQGIRAEIDDRSERLPAKIRDAQMEKVPYMLTIGDREIDNNQLNVRQRDGSQQTVKVEDFIKETVEIVKQKRLESSLLT